MSADTSRAAVGRFAAALPDLVSCGIYLFAWFFPLALGAVWVKNLMASMALEFAILHSSGVIGTTLADPRSSRRRKAGTLLRFGAMYLMMVAAFCVAFETWWPIAAFAWLLAAKIAVIWLAPLPTHVEQSRQSTFTLISLVVFLLGAPLISELPVPEFGIDAAVREAAGLPASTNWDETPHRVMAFGAIYFAVQAWAKWRWRLEWGVQVR